MTTNKTRKNKTFDFRTILFLDLLIMVFMLFSGKPEVTLLSFFVAVIVLIAGRQYYTFNSLCDNFWSSLFLLLCSYSYANSYIASSYIFYYRYYRFYHSANHSVYDVRISNQRTKEFIRNYDCP